MAADSCRLPAGAEHGAGASAETEAGDLTAAQRDVLERSLQALRHANNDSHVLAALLLITRVCPASQLDPPTLRRIFEAVGVALPARLLLTALKGGGRGAALPPGELLSLGTALLAALSTHPDMAAQPQLLATVPLLLRILDRGAEDRDGAEGPDGEGGAESWPDEAAAADCFRVLDAVCASPGGPEQLLSRGAVPALCRAALRRRGACRRGALRLLPGLLSGPLLHKAWSGHWPQLLLVLLQLTEDLCAATDEERLDLCSQLVRFLPPGGGAASADPELRGAVARLWAALGPTLRSKLTPRQSGPVLVLGASLLDLCGWEPVGPPKLCCLLVNRACVEVRMALEQPPGTQLSPELTETLTGCYRIMEAAIEQACGATLAPASAGPAPSLSLAQTRQVLAVLQEAFGATVFYLQQVEPDRYGEPFVFATFRCLCSWLAEETSCLREEVSLLLPFLISYSRCHLQEGESRRRLSDWMSRSSVRAEGGACGGEALRYLLPALCHLSAEPAPRKVLLGLDTPALLVDLLSLSWTSMRERGLAARDPGMETACSALLNFVVTEPQRLRTDACFGTLEAMLSQALPLLVHKPALLVLSANYCTLGLMIGRTKRGGPIGATQRPFLRAALRLLGGALASGGGPAAAQAQASRAWEESWEEAAELWRLSLQALGGCVRAQPSLCALLRDEGWLRHALAAARSAAPPDRHTLAALEEALSAAAESCALCREEVAVAMTTGDGGALSGMKSLRKILEAK